MKADSGPWTPTVWFLSILSLCVGAKMSSRQEIKGHKVQEPRSEIWKGRPWRAMSIKPGGGNPWASPNCPKGFYPCMLPCLLGIPIPSVRVTDHTWTTHFCRSLWLLNTATDPLFQWHPKRPEHCPLFFGASNLGIIQLFVLKTVIF